jgi:hypothetical protein
MTAPPRSHLPSSLQQKLSFVLSQSASLSFPFGFSWWLLAFNALGEPPTPDAKFAQSSLNGVTHITMASKYKDKDAGVVVSFNGKWISWFHTALAYGQSPRTSLDPVNNSVPAQLSDGFLVYIQLLSLAP